MIVSCDDYMSGQTGEIDRTMHAYLHIAIPLGISLIEMERCITDLIAHDLIEADPGFDRLIRLTPRGVTASEAFATREIVASDMRETVVEWHGFAVPHDIYAHLAAASERMAD